MENIKIEDKKETTEGSIEKPGEVIDSKGQDALDQRIKETEERIKSTGEEGIEGELLDEEAYEEEIEDWDKLLEENPELGKLGIDSVGGLIKSYLGGLKDFKKRGEVTAELEKLGIDTPEKARELLGQLRQFPKAPPSPGSSEEPITFANVRRRMFEGLIPETQVDPTTGEAVKISPEDRKKSIDQLNQLAEHIFPSQLVDVMSGIQQMNQNLFEELQWLQFKYTEHWDGKVKDKPLISNEIRQHIKEHSKQYPHTYQEIIAKAIMEGKNIFDAAYNHFIAVTKKEDITKAQREHIKKELEEEEKKRREKTSQLPSGEKIGSQGPVENIVDLNKRILAREQRIKSGKY